MSAMQKRKGKTGEREVVLLARQFGLAAARTWELAQSPNAALRHSDVVIQTKPYQVKRRRQLKFLYEALADVEGCFLRGDGKEWLVVLRAEDYLRSLNGTA